MKMTRVTKMFPYSTQVSQQPKQTPSCRNKTKQKTNTKWDKQRHPLPMMPQSPLFPNFILVRSLFKRVPVLYFALPLLLESHRIFELYFQKVPGLDSFTAHTDWGDWWKWIQCHNRCSWRSKLLQCITLNI